MHRMNTKTAQKDKFGAGKNGFTRGNPGPARLPPIWMMTTLTCCRKRTAWWRHQCQHGEGRHDQPYRASCAAVKSQNPFGDIKSGRHGENGSSKPWFEAAKRNVGTGANQIPDMSLFASINTVTAAKFPSGLILQCGQLNGAPNVSSTYGMRFPMTFSRVIAVVVTLNVTGAAGQPRLYRRQVSEHWI